MSSTCIKNRRIRCKSSKKKSPCRYKRSIKRCRRVNLRRSCCSSSEESHTPCLSRSFSDSDELFVHPTRSRIVCTEQIVPHVPPVSCLPTNTLVPNEWPDEPVLQDEDKSGKCVICYNRKACVIANPCYHLSLCVTCSRECVLQKENYSCPICRERVITYTKIFDQSIQ